MTWPSDGAGVIRLSPAGRTRRRPGEAVPDATYAAARRLVVGSSLPFREIARQLGLGSATPGRWAMAAGWERPLAAPPWSGRRGVWGRHPQHRAAIGRGLRQAEIALRHLEEAAVPIAAGSGRALDRLEEALTHLDDAARALASVSAGGAGRWSGG